MKIQFSIAVERMSPTDVAQLYETQLNNAIARIAQLETENRELRVRVSMKSHDWDSAQLPHFV
jgi:hypothetical protein